MIEGYREAMSEPKIEEEPTAECACHCHVPDHGITEHAKGFECCAAAKNPTVEELRAFAPCVCECHLDGEHSIVHHALAPCCRTPYNLDGKTFDIDGTLVMADDEKAARVALDAIWITEEPGAIACDDVPEHTHTIVSATLPDGRVTRCAYCNFPDNQIRRRVARAAVRATYIDAVFR